MKWISHGQVSVLLNLFKAIKRKVETDLTEECRLTILT